MMHHRDPSACNLRTLDNGFAWDLQFWKVVHIKPRLERQDMDVYSISCYHTEWFQIFSPDGTLAAAPTPDNIIFVWNIYTGLLVKRIGPQKSVIKGLAISPDNTMIFSSALGDLSNATTRQPGAFIWEITTGKILHSFVDVMLPREFSFSPSSNYLLLANGSGVHIWSRETRQVFDIRSEPEIWSFSSFSPVRTQLSHFVNPHLVIWDIASDEQFIKHFPIPINPQDDYNALDQPVFSSRNSKNSNQNAENMDEPPLHKKEIKKKIISSRGAGALWDKDGILKVIDLTSGSILFTESNCYSHKFDESCGFSDNGQRISYISETNGIVVREMEHYSILFSIPRGNGRVVFALLPDGTKLAIASDSTGSLTVWNMDTKAKLSSTHMINWCYYYVSIRISLSGNNLAFQKFDDTTLTIELESAFKSVFMSELESESETAGVSGVGGKEAKSFLGSGNGVRSEILTFPGHNNFTSQELICFDDNLKPLWSTVDELSAVVFTSDSTMLVVSCLNMRVSKLSSYAVLSAKTGHRIYEFPISPYLERLHWECLSTEISVPSPSRNDYIKSAFGYLNIQTGKLESTIPGLQVPPIIYNSETGCLERAGKEILKIPDQVRGDEILCYSWGNHVLLHINRSDCIHLEFSFPVGAIPNKLQS